MWEPSSALPCGAILAPGWPFDKPGNAELGLTKSHECDIRNGVGRGQFCAGASGLLMAPRRLRKKGRIFLQKARIVAAAGKAVAACRELAGACYFYGYNRRLHKACRAARIPLSWHKNSLFRVINFAVIPLSFPCYPVIISRYIPCYSGRDRAGRPHQPLDLVCLLPSGWGGMPNFRRLTTGIGMVG
jgi:hypothetical protein